MRAILEVTRVIIILLVGYAILWVIERNIYTVIGVDVDSNLYLGLASLANLLILLVLYRNKLQFSGWYKGYKKSLSKVTTLVLIITSGFLLCIIPFIT